MINEFRGEYYFLSNFYEEPITYKGIPFLNNEAAFQGMKNFQEAPNFSKLNPSDAKEKVDTY